MINRALQLNKYINMPQLKFYFNVSNSYVLYKLLMIIFPYRNKVCLALGSAISNDQSWTRTVCRSDMTGQVEGFKPPREDLNSPDLYIPGQLLVPLTPFPKPQ